MNSGKVEILNHESDTGNAFTPQTFLFVSKHQTIKQYQSQFISVPPSISPSLPQDLVYQTVERYTGNILRQILSVIFVYVSIQVKNMFQVNPVTGRKERNLFMCNLYSKQRQCR